MGLTLSLPYSISSPILVLIEMFKDSILLWYSRNVRKSTGYSPAHTHARTNTCAYTHTYILQIHAQTSMWNYNFRRWIILLRNITNNVTITKRVPCPVERVGGLKSELSLCHVILTLRSKTGVQKMHVQQK